VTRERITEAPAVVVQEATERALREYLDDVLECRVEDLDVTALAHHVAVRLRFGFPVEPITVEADPTPAQGTARPDMLLVGLDH
jgi:hypothetical protein